MNKNTSISLGEHFESFVRISVSEGRCHNASEVIRPGLRLSEEEKEEESKVIALRSVIQEGINSGITTDFSADKHLESLKKKRASNG